MKASSKKPIRVAVIESARLPFSELNSQASKLPNIEVVSVSLAELGSRKDFDIVLLSTSLSKDMLSLVAGVRALHRFPRIIVAGNCTDDETILKILASGVRGYIDETASTKDFLRAVRDVHSGLVWVPKRILAIFVNRVKNPYGRL